MRLRFRHRIGNVACVTVLNFGVIDMSNIIEVESLRKEYYETVAVNDINWSVPNGEIFGLIGPNGAGKTTILRMLATTLEPTSGKIRFEGKDIYKDLKTVRSKLGFMPDFFQLYGTLKTYELLNFFGIAHGLGGRELSNRVAEVLELIGLTEKRDAFCRGLSRGMMQRLGLGRAIIHTPKLLLLDEPASGLDPLARKVLFDLLRQVHKNGTTILISSHILGELSELCTSTAIMHDGVFLETGKTSDILKKIMPTRRIIIQLLDGADKAAGILAARDDVEDITTEGKRLTLSFTGEDPDLAEINAALVQAGIPVCLLEEGKTSLHELYFAIAERNNADAAS